MAPVKNRGLQKQSAANNRLLDPDFFSDQWIYPRKQQQQDWGNNSVHLATWLTVDFMLDLYTIDQWDSNKTWIHFEF